MIAHWQTCLAIFMMSLVAGPATADTLKVGTRFPDLEFIDAESSELKPLNHQDGKRILFVFASW